MRQRFVWALVSVRVDGIGGDAVAQAPPRPTPVWTENSRGTGPLDRLAFRAIGPATPSGRVDDVAVLESDPSTFYVAMATVGHLQDDQRRHDLHAGLRPRGQRLGRGRRHRRRRTRTWCGQGRARTTTASPRRGVTASTSPPTAAAPGRTWALRDSKQIARIIVDPVDFNVVHVAALGDLWSAGGERGVYKTTDGGLTWRRVLHVDDDTGATELVMDPLNNKTLYAATYQRRRAQWGMNGGGPGSAIWKSTDGGETWTKLENGVPSGPKGRIGLDIYRRNPNVLLRAHRAPGGERRLPLGRRRRELEKVERRESAPDVFQPDPHRSADRFPHLRTGRSTPRLRRWRQDLPRRWRRAHPRGSPRHVDQSERSAPPDPRQRRRRRHLARPCRHLGLHAQPARRAGVSRRVRHAVPLSRVRGSAGQQHLVRAERGAHQQRHHQRRLVRHQRRRRVPAAHGSHRFEHRLRRVAGRPHEPHQPDDERADGGAARAARAEALRAVDDLPLQLGHGDAALAVRSEDDLHRRERGLEVVGPGPVLPADQP